VTPSAPIKTMKNIGCGLVAVKLKLPGIFREVIKLGEDSFAVCEVPVIDGCVLNDDADRWATDGLSPQDADALRCEMGKLLLVATVRAHLTVM